MTSGEDRLIARFFKPIATHPAALALSDDAAVLQPPPGHELVLTADAVIAGVHFLADDPPDAMARKALRVNLSDLAAKGAKPVGFLLTLALPASIDEAWLARFSSGLKADADAFACPLFGGDTTRTSGPVAISIFALGSVPQGSMVRRSGAKAGDRVIVTGTIGDAALGLANRTQPDTARNWNLDLPSYAQLIGRYLLPEPRLGLADALQSYASAAMDVSDGLVGDLAKLCGTSGVSAKVNVPLVPLSQAAQRAVSSDAGLMETILTGGDDYEIVCTVPPDHIPDFWAGAAAADIAVTDIGEIIAGHEEPRFVDAAGTALSFAQKSFSHF